MFKSFSTNIRSSSHVFAQSSKSMFDFSHLSPQCLNHLKRVYSCILACTLLSIAGFSTGGFLFLKPGIITGLITLGLIVYIYLSPNTPQTVHLRLCLLMASSFLMGVNCEPLMNVVTKFDPRIIPTAFLTTALVFTAFSLSVLKSPSSRTLLYCQGFVLAFFNSILWISITAWILPSWVSKPFSDARELLAVGLMCVYTVMDTQLILDKFSYGDDDFIKHSINLFLDLFRLFEQIANVLLMKEVEKKKSQCGKESKRS
ncbi:hypothetical protein ACOME3_006033 [Neoechinorhynchus agilis]